MAMLFDFRVLARHLPLADLRNPARTPEEYLDVLDRISQWSRAGLKAATALVSGNAKGIAQVLLHHRH